MHFLIRCNIYSSYAWQMRCIFVFLISLVPPKTHKDQHHLPQFTSLDCWLSSISWKTLCCFLWSHLILQNKKTAHCNMRFFPFFIAQLYCTESVCVYILRLLALRYMWETVWAPLVNTPHRVSPELWMRHFSLPLWNHWLMPAFD